ncbi:MAG TPA: SHOCT domain-containing protein, partial [Candidatus Limnocylindrales bacterium]
CRHRQYTTGAAPMVPGWGMTLDGWIWMMVWVAALLLMVWLIVAGGRDRPPRENALEILRARFARGEIDEDEFERARDVLLEDHAEFTR